MNQKEIEKRKAEYQEFLRNGKYCRSCRDWFYNKHDLQSIIDTRFCKHCISEKTKN